MAAELFTTPARATDADGVPYAGAKWYFYAHNTTTRQYAYADAALETPLPNPVVADAGGKFPAIYFDSSKVYRGVCKNASGSVTLYDFDPINTGTAIEAAADRAEAAAEIAEEAAETAQAASDLAQSYGNIPAYATWALLNAVVGDANDLALIPADSGTHTDPVVGGTVSNSGLFQYDDSPAGWERIGSTQAALAAASAAAAAASAAAAQSAALSDPAILQVRRDAAIIADSPYRSLAEWEAGGLFVAAASPSVDSAGLSVGSVTANTLTGFANPANTVYDSAPDGVTTVRRMRVTAAYNYQFLLATEDDAHRDMEIDTWVQGGTFFLRLDGTGKAIRFDLGGSITAPNLEVALASGIADGNPGAAVRLYYSADLSADFPAIPFGDDIETDYYTFGVSGCDIYAKYNGVEIIRLRSALHMAKGRLAVMTPGGARQLDVRLLHTQVLYGAPEQGKWDIRDLGCKAFKTTGSIAAGDNELTVADATGAAVGDPIILAVGGEAGLGHRATVGVGGTFPSLSYANAGAMNADASKPNNTKAYLQDTGYVYVYQSGAWVAWNTLSFDYYCEKFIPQPLKTTITAIAGNVLTLADNAVVSSAGCDVWFDNQPTLAASGLIGGSNPSGYDWSAWLLEDQQVRVPAGEFGIGTSVSFNDCDGYTVYGDGHDIWGDVDEGEWDPLSWFVVPPGIQASLGAVTSSNLTFRDLGYRGNGRDNGYGLNTTQFNPILGCGGINFGACEVLVAKWLKVVDGLTATVVVSATNEFLVERCLGVMTDGLRTYHSQWQFNAVDCGEVSGSRRFVDCRFESPSLVHAFEMFRSAGVHYIRPSGRNVVMSSNFSGDFVIDAPNFVIEALSDNGAKGEANPYDQLTAVNPIININANANSGTPWVVTAHNAGGLIRNPRIIQEGYANADDETHTGINVTSSPNVRVTGTFPNFPGKGLIYAPDAVAGSPAGRTGVNIDSADATVRGVRVIGAAAPDYNYYSAVTTPGDAVVEDTIADAFLLGGDPSIPATCMTNDDWLALHPGDHVVIEEAL